MSATATPISPERFALAIVDLPLANLHFKASELRNSIAHLRSSNQQLQSFADEGDQDCQDAIRENLEVIARNEERIDLLRREVERRGFGWDFTEVEAKEDRDGSADTVNGNSTHVNGVIRGNGTAGGGEAEGERGGGSLTDDELSRRLMEQMEQDDDTEGLHL